MCLKVDIQKFQTIPQGGRAVHHNKSYDVDNNTKPRQRKQSRGSDGDSQIIKRSSTKRQVTVIYLALIVSQCLPLSPCSQNFAKGPDLHCA